MGLANYTELDLLTACIFIEGRGEPYEGQVAIGNVILNCTKYKMATPIKDHILAPKQFSWTFSPKDPNFQLVNNIIQRTEPVPQSWEVAHKIADGLLSGQIGDNTSGSDHYCNVPLTFKLNGDKLPRWIEEALRNGKKTCIIGCYTFFKLVG